MGHSFSLYTAKSGQESSALKQLAHADRLMNGLAHERIQGLKTASELKSYSTLVNLSMEHLKNFLKLKLLQSVLRLEVKLSSEYKFDHSLTPGRTLGVQASSQVHLLLP